MLEAALAPFRDDPRRVPVHLVIDADCRDAVVVGDACLLGLRDTGLQLHAEHRRLRAFRADADQRGTTHLRMHVEHRLDLFGAQRAGGRDHAMALAAAEPQPAFGIEVTEIAHAMHDARAAVGQRFGDLRQPRLRVAVEVGVGGTGAGHGDLADLAPLHLQPVRPFGKRGVVDTDDAHFVRRHRAADAGAGAVLGARAQVEQLATFDDGDGQAFGRAVGRPEARVVG